MPSCITWLSKLHRTSGLSGHTAMWGTMLRLFALLKRWRNLSDARVLRARRNSGVAASSRRHWTAEIITVKMISSSRLKPHGTGWSRYMLLSPSLRRRWRRAARTRHMAAGTVSVSWWCRESRWQSYLWSSSRCSGTRQLGFILLVLTSALAVVFSCSAG